VHRRRYFAKPRIVIGVPSGITAVEQRAVKEAGYQAGARRVYIIEEPMAAASGAGLPVHEATGNMVVDVGGGTTEVAVISLGGIVTSQSICTAGDGLDQAIACAILDRGLGLTGGRALLSGLDERIRHETGMPVHVADDPLDSVALGAGRCVEYFEALQQVLVSEPRR